MVNRFKDKLLNSDEFLLTFELVPGSSSKGKSVEKTLTFAKQAVEENVLDALTITDNPGGNPSLSPDVLGREIKQMGIEPVVHFACRDFNRNSAFSRALQLDRLDIENLLVLTGDYPTDDAAGKAKPCFDLDSVTATCLLKSMNGDSEPFCIKNQNRAGEKANFFLGAAVSCYKATEAEVINQYYKMLKKIRNGSQFIITQICYDGRKFDELIRFVKRSNCSTPLIGSVYVLNSPAAKYMNQGNVPGAYLPDKLFDAVAREAQGEDKGKAASLMRSAKLVAILKGLGYRGAHISGKIDYNDLKQIIKNFKELENDWQSFVSEFNFPYQNGFYLYEKDVATGLNTDELSPKAGRSAAACINLALFKVVHKVNFDKTTWQWPMLSRAAKTIDKHSVLKVPFCLLEDISKTLLFNCQKCGDCALEDLAYFCPESKCPKFLRNGQCGGSEKGFCEVHKEKKCVWVRVYERLKAHNEIEKLNGFCLPPRNWDLDKTSSWLNLYLGRDYHATLSKCRQTQKICKSP